MISAVDTSAMMKSAVGMVTGVTPDYEQSTIRTVVLQMAATMRAPIYDGEKKTEPEAQASPVTKYSSCRKRVHFPQNYTYTVTIPPVDLADADKLWWDAVSLDNRRSSDKLLADQNSLHANPVYHESVLFLMQSYKTERHCRQKLMARVQTLRDTEVRGLEQRIVTVLKAHRSISVNEVLKLQKRIQEEGNTRPEMVAVMLRQKSLKMSRAARQLAFRLAQADRQDAKEIHGENRSYSLL